MDERQRAAGRAEAAYTVRLRLARKARLPLARTPPPRCWFRGEDGTCYRNCTLIKAERNEVRHWPAGTPGKWPVHDALADEWWAVFRAGVTRKAILGPGDVEVTAASFREAYPRNPGLWMLDGPRG